MQILTYINYLSTKSRKGFWKCTAQRQIAFAY
nr:MAG TPA: hypothetical protein [Caudoviricetes sp.]